jgi:hypothetical protein
MKAETAVRIPNTVDDQVESPAAMQVLLPTMLLDLWALIRICKLPGSKRQ